MIIVYETQYSQPIRHTARAALYLAQKIPSLDRARSLKVIRTSRPILPTLMVSQRD